MTGIFNPGFLIPEKANSRRVYPAGSFCVKKNKFWFRRRILEKALHTGIKRAIITILADELQRIINVAEQSSADATEFCFAKLNNVYVSVQEKNP